MTNRELAKGLIKQAKSRLKTAGVVWSEGNYPCCTILAGVRGTLT